MAEEDEEASEPETAPAEQNPLDFSALLETPTYDLFERGADRQGYEIRDIKPGETR